MRSAGIREAKAQFSALVRAAAAGELTLLTDHGKPLAVIAPLPGDASEASDDLRPPIDAAAFRHALLAIPYEPEMDF
jgi:prevent-host-death family protein